MASLLTPRRALPTFMDEHPGRLSCRDRPDLFVSFNDRGAARSRRVRRAAALCSDCPLKAACLAWAVEWGQDGVFGGKLVSRGRVLQ
jgi:WhiB family transcriptional regulator, redox-sensing transcriptional regulator